MTTPGQRRAGERVRLARAQLGLNQADFAERANVDPGTVSGLEIGKRWPRTGKQLGIERALGWEPGTLEQIARDYAEPRPAPEDNGAQDAAVHVLTEALSTFERTIMASDLPAEKKVEIIQDHRATGGDGLLEKYRDRLRRRSNG